MKNISVSLIAAGTVVMLALIGGSVYLAAKDNQVFVATGTAKQFFTPDRLVTHITLTETQQEQSQATQKLSERLAELKKQLTAIGISESQLQQGNVSISSYAEPSEQPEKSVKKAHVSQELTLRFDSTKKDDIKNKAAEITRVVTTQNPIIDSYHFTYDFQNKDSAIQKLRESAIENARKKAESVASSVGLQVGKILSIQENDNGNYPMPYKTMAIGVDENASLSTEPSDEEISYSISLTYQLKPKRVLGLW